MQSQQHQINAETITGKGEDDMNLILRYRGLNPHAVWKGLAETQLRKLRNLAAIAAARVTFEWQHGVKPAFRVRALLEVPGPDFHAEASDHTLPAALLKVVKNLERQMRARRNRRAGKAKTNVQLGLDPGHWSGGLMNART